MESWGLDKPQLLAFLIALIAGSIAAGYVARRLGAGERVARVLMYFVVLVPYSVIGFLAIWRLSFHGEFVLLPLFGFAVMCAGLAAGAAFARALKLPDRSAGALVLTTGASNLGFTMGGFVNYVLFGPAGLATAAMYTLFWNFGMVFVLFPIARHYGHGSDQPLWKLILVNLVDIRSLPLVAVLAGLTINLCGVAYPERLTQAILGPADLLGVLIVAGVVVSFFATGLRLHFAGVFGHKLIYTLVGASKFVIMPAVGAGLIGIMWLVGHPMPGPGNGVVLVQASTPTAIYAVVISNLFHLDDKLASIIFVVNTAIYLVAILPLIVVLFA